MSINPVDSPQALTAEFEIAPPVSVKALRCNVWFSVTVETAPSGRVYRFVPQQVRGVGYEDGDILPDDVGYLLTLQKPGGSCCGSGDSGPYSYFVKE